MQAPAPSRSPQPNPALAQAERLAWLFRGSDGGAGAVHPLLQPLACLRGLADAPSLVVAQAPEPPPPQPPRHTIDRAWLCARVDALPTLPQAVLGAIRVLQQDSSSTAQCAAALGRDPALAAMLLRLANAAAYGHSGRIGSLYEAVVLLGRDAVGSVLTAAAVAAQFPDARCPGFDRQRHGRHAVASGIAAQTLASELGEDAGLAFTAGLMHDIGQLVLVSQLPAAMAQALAWARLHDQPLHLAEQEVLGIDHAEAGALVARHWQFPPALVAVLASHHGTSPQSAAVPVWLLDVVQAANALAHALDLHQAEDERVPALDPDVCQRLDLTPARCARVLAVTEQGVAALADALLP